MSEELDNQLRGPGVTAGELLVDGVLRYYAATDAVARERRVVRVLSALEAEGAEEAADAGLRSGAPAVGGAAVAPAREEGARRGAWRMPRWMLSAAAVLALASSALLFILPGADTATAEVQSVAARLRAAGDRRFEVAVNTWMDEDTVRDTIDMRSPEGLLLVTHRPPWEDEPLVMGKDAEGYWLRRRDGSVDRRNAERGLPPWIQLEGSSLFETRLDELLEKLPEKYTLSSLEPAAITEGGAKFDRVAAVRKLVHRVKPDTVMMWFDQSTRELERVEFAWEDPRTRVVTDPELPPPKRRPGGPARRDDEDGRPPRGPRDEMERGGDELGPPPLLPPPPRMREGRDGGPMGGRGFEGPPPPPGEREGDGPRRDPRRGPPPTPRSIVMQRVDIAPLPAGWFTPEGQAGGR